MSSHQMKLLEDSDLQLPEGFVSSQCRYYDEGNQRMVLINDQLTYCYDLTDKLAKKLIWVNIYENNHATQQQIAVAIGGGVRTVRDWVARYRTEGGQGLQDRPKTGAPKKITEGVRKRIYRLRDRRETTSEIARKCSISKRSVEKELAERSRKACLKQETFLKEEEQAEEPREILVETSAEIEKPIIQAEALKADTDILESEESLDRSLDRTLARLGQIQDVSPKFCESEKVEWAGLFMVAVALGLDPYLKETLNVYNQFKSAFYGLRTVMVTLIMMTLLRVNRPEQLRNFRPEKLGRILGLDRAPEVKTLRRKIQELSTQGKAVTLMDTLGKERTKEYEGDTRIAYVDGHIQAYTGSVKIGKIYSSSASRVVKGRTENWVNLAGGLPLMSVECEFNEGLVKALPKVISQVKKVTGHDQMTHVFDRGGHSGFLFEQLIKNGDDFITYRKGKFDLIDPARFIKGPVIINGKEYEYSPLEQEITLPVYQFEGAENKYRKTKREVKLREIRIQRPDGRQTSILTSRRDLKAVDVASLMFSRWAIQENMFKYMIAEFDLDSLWTYGSEEISDPTLDHPNPAYITQEKKIAKLQAKRMSLLSKSGELIELENEEEIKKKIEEIKSPKIVSQLNLLNTQLKDAEETLQKIPQREKVSEAGYKRLKTESKLLLNTVKISAYILETKLFEMLSHSYSNTHKEGRKLISAAFKTAGSIKLAEGKILIQLDPQSSPSRTKAINEVCSQLNSFKAKFPGSHRIIEFIPTSV